MCKHVTKRYLFSCFITMNENVMMNRPIFENVDRVGAPVYKLFAL